MAVAVGSVVARRRRCGVVRLRQQRPRSAGTAVTLRAVPAMTRPARPARDADPQPDRPGRGRCTHQLAAAAGRSCKRMQADNEFRFSELVRGKGRRAKQDAAAGTAARAAAAAPRPRRRRAVPRPGDSAWPRDRAGQPARRAAEVARHADDCSRRPTAPAAGQQPLDLSALATAAMPAPAMRRRRRRAARRPQRSGDRRSRSAERRSADRLQARLRAASSPASTTPAETAFRQFLATYPGDQRAADAQYWLGESLFSRGMYRDAALEFRERPQALSEEHARRRHAAAARPVAGRHSASARRPARPSRAALKQYPHDVECAAPAGHHRTSQCGLLRRRARPLSDAELDGLFAPFAGATLIALAVSGGADSLALMVAVDRWRRRRRGRPTSLVLTVDHRLRRGSGGEAADVVASPRGARARRARARARGPQPPADIEAAARGARYRLLHRRGAAQPAPAISSPPTIATIRPRHFCMRLQRGAGVFGLAAMRPVRRCRRRDASRGRSSTCRARAWRRRRAAAGLDPGRRCHERRSALCPRAHAQADAAARSGRGSTPARLAATARRLAERRRRDRRRGERAASPRRSTADRLRRRAARCRAVRARRRRRCGCGCWRGC